VSWRSPLKLKLLASYFGQTYVTLIGVLISPVYVHYLGAEGFGLVGIFTLLQTWLMLLDFGFSATLARETSRFAAGEGEPAAYRHLVATLSRIFLASGVAIAVLGVAGSPWISRHWLKLGKLSPSEVTVAVAIMAVTVALRWRTEPYRSMFIGFERQVWLNAFNSIFATLRYVGAALVLAIFHAGITVFFIYQLVVAIAETATIVIAAHRLIPERPPRGEERRRMWPTIKPLMRFSIGVAFTSAVWLFVSQFDKLILSTILPLKAYGVFALATLAASGIGILGAPVYQVMLPRLTVLKAKGDEYELRRIYRTGTAFVTALVTPASLLLALFGENVLWVWTGDRTISAQAYPILKWYALGNACLSPTAFTYYLQYAHGDMKLHVRGNVILAVLFVPATTFAAFNYGAVGTGMVWFAAGLCYLLGWSFVVHSRFAPGLHWNWLGQSVGLVGLPSAAILLVARLIGLPWYQSRGMDLLMLAVVGCAAFAASAALVPGVVSSALAMVRPRRTAP
jgi:O-antigen/teichoic acid export membrane protein